MSNPTAPPAYAETDDKKYNAPPANTMGYDGTPQPYPNQGYPPPTGGYSQPGYVAPPPQSYAYPQPAHDSVALPSAAGYGTAPDHHHPVDMGEEGGFSARRNFDDKNVRRMFIRKVYVVLMIQLAVTFGIVCIFTLVDDVKTWVKANPGFYWASYAVFLVLYIVLLCVESIRRKSPHNLILLSLFTLAMSYMTGTIAAYYDTQAVMTALGVTVIVCLAVSLFSMQTKFDFTRCTGLLFVLLMVLMIFGFITIFTHSRSYYVQIVYGCLGALVFTLFLAFDTQLVMGGKKYELDAEEYIYGAIILYIDVVYIFWFLLSIFGSSN